MAEYVKVALDAMGGDNAPGEIIKGAIDALKERDNLFVYVVGKKDIIEEQLASYTYDKNRLEVVDATEVIDTAEPPVMAIRKKKDSSIVKGMNMVKDTADMLIRLCKCRIIRSDLSRRTGHCRQDKAGRETSACTACTYKRRSFTSDRLWCKHGCKTVFPCSVRKDGQCIHEICHGH